MLPPFYYKNVTDDGLFASYAEVIERVGDARLRIYLYHIPPVSQVPISLALIERLLARYPQTVAGIKDSSGDFGNTRAMLDRFAAQGFAVFAGNETFLLATLRGGGAGCISAIANVNPAAIAGLARDWQRPDADARQADVDRVRKALAPFPMIPALKYALARRTGNADWNAVRPPLRPLADTAGEALMAALNAAESD
jgi:4-hydroxy-tetrahydrodipicolinate synthase